MTATAIKILFIVEASILIVRFGTIAHADQLPAPASPHEQQCEMIFNGIKDALIAAMNLFYSTGVRDRDDLAKRMVQYAEKQGLFGLFQRNCADISQNFSTDAMLAMAYHLIAQRFGNPK